MLNTRVYGQIIITAALLAGYWALMMFVAFGGHPAGTLQPDANLARYIDEMILGKFRDGTTYTWILSGLGFTATVLLGVLAGQVLKSAWWRSAKFTVLLMLGALCLCAGYAWGFDPARYEFVVPAEYRFPIIKHAWTSSMVLWAGGWSYLLLALFYLVIDVLGFRAWAFPFVVIGSNAIAVYMATHLFDFHHIGDIFVGGLAGHVADYTYQALRDVAAFAVVWLILFYLYRKKTFIRV
jgi:predicted acyltransferase